MAKKAPKPRRPAKTPTLTLKMKAFCFWMVSAECYGNGTESARRAKYAGSDVVLAGIAYENLRKPQIQAEINRLEAEAFRGADITIEKVLRDCEAQRRMALSLGQLAPAVKCSELQGKYLKMWVEKIEHVQTLEDIELDQLVHMAQELAEVAGIDIGRLFSGNGSVDGLGSDNSGSKTTH
ncbi:MAG: terminase small subunit [Pseudohongiellaceae bacterium]